MEARMAKAAWETARGGLLAVAALAFLAVSGPMAQAEGVRLFSFGTAGINGNYYRLGLELCALINREASGELRCSPEPTAGSQYNLVAMGRGELEFALVQSDWQRRAYEGTGAFADRGPMTELRSVASLYAEAVTLVARVDSGIDTVDDLPGKVVDIGGASTARRATNEAALAGLGFSLSEFERVAEFSGQAVVSAICDGRVDATMIVIGHPNATMGDALARCNLKLVPIDGPRARDFLRESADFEAFRIGGGLYAAHPEPVATVSVFATLVTVTTVPDDLVGLLAGTLLNNHDQLSETLPFLGGGSVRSMSEAGLTAPLHPAADRALASAPAD
jgi:TRAP transporter TAXI family solute receptor